MTRADHPALSTIVSYPQATLPRSAQFATMSEAAPPGWVGSAVGGFAVVWPASGGLASGGLASGGLASGGPASGIEERPRGSRGLS